MWIWILAIVAFILLLVFFYPLRFRFFLTFHSDLVAGKLLLHPLFCLKSRAITLWDSEHPQEKKPAKKEEAPEPAAPKEAAAKYHVTPEKVLDQLDEILIFLRDSGRGVKRLRMRLLFAYTLVDPSYTGRAAGVIYAMLPQIFGDVQRCRWRVSIEPDWQATELYGNLKGDLIVNVFDLLLAFAPLVPRALRFRKTFQQNKGGIPHERTSH